MISLRKTPALYLLICAVLMCSLCPPARAAVPPIPPGFKKLEGKYHTLIYDITDDEAHEVLQRMEAIVDEYLVRTREFSGRLQGKMPFMIFRRRSDYLDNGGLPNTDGVFIRDKALMAVAGDKLTLRTWHVIQHEGFHQFAAYVIGGELPPWINEGLAEYFGEAVYTGDGFVSGAIPEYRLQRIQETIKSGGFLPVSKMLNMSYQTWNDEMNTRNYDQGWAMVQFLAHADDGKYQKPLTTYMQQLARGMQPRQAWNTAFGSAEGFETRWSEYWNALEKNPTMDIYARADAQMLASYAGRAAAQRQVFKDVDELTAAIKDGTIKAGPQDSLPKTLASECTDLTTGLQNVSVKFVLQTTPAATPAARPPGGSVKCTTPDGTIITANFRTRGTRGAMADVKVETPKVKPAAKSPAH